MQAYIAGTRKSVGAHGLKPRAHLGGTPRLCLTLLRYSGVALPAWLRHASLNLLPLCLLIPIQYDLTAGAAFHYVEALLKIVNGKAVGNDAADV